MKNEINLEEKLKILIKLLESNKYYKEYSVRIYERDSLNEIYIDLDEINDKESIEIISEKIKEMNKEMNTKYRFYIEEIFNSCENCIIENFVPYIKFMVYEQGICINYNNKIYRLRKFKGIDFAKCECYSLSEYGKGYGYIHEIKDEIQLTINENTIAPIFINEETRKKSIEYRENQKIKIKKEEEIEKIKESINELKKIGLSNREIETELKNIINIENETFKTKVKLLQK